MIAAITGTRVISLASQYDETVMLLQLEVAVSERIRERKYMQTQSVRIKSRPQMRPRPVQ